TVVHLHLLRYAFLGNELAQTRGQRDIEAQHQNGLMQGLRELQAAVAENQGLARAGYAVNHPVAIAETTRQLLLLDVHDAHDLRQGLSKVGRRATGILKETALLRADTDLRKQ